MLKDEEKKAINLLKMDLACTIKANECGLATKGEYDNEIKAYKTILNLIEKQSKEIEELKEIYQTGYVNGCVSKVYEINKKWKDKIKAMLENEIINISGFECVAKGDVQSLLEKE